MAAQVTGARNVSPTGHLGEQLGGADESAGPADENLEDLPFGWSEADVALRRGHGPAGDVDDSTSDPDSRCGADPACAPQDGTQACKEFCSVERLGDVVVSSGVECRDLVSTFTLSQAGMVSHWRAERSQGWASRAFINGLGAVLTLAALAIELISKFTEGAWLIVLIIPLLVLMFARVHSTYDKIGSLLQIDRIPPPPVKQDALVVVPVGGMSRLTQEGISAALSLGDHVIAVTVIFTGEEDTESEARLRQEWDEWHPGVPLVTLRSEHRSLGPPIVEYLRGLEAQDKFHRIVVLIPEVQPARPWQRILHNQRGFVLDRAIQKGTVNVVVCRLHFQRATLSTA